MAQSPAERQRRHRERVRAAAAEAAARAPSPAVEAERPPSLIIQGLRLGIAHGDTVYCIDLMPGEALQLAMRLFTEIGIGVQLTPTGERESPRPMSVNTPIAAIKVQGHG